MFAGWHGYRIASRSHLTHNVPTGCSQAVLLRRVGGSGMHDACDVIGSSRSAVKSLLFRAREEFRQVYQRMGGSDPLGGTDLP